MAFHTSSSLSPLDEYLYYIKIIISVAKPVKLNLKYTSHSAIYAFHGVCVCGVEANSKLVTEENEKNRRPSKTEPASLIENS